MTFITDLDDLIRHRHGDVKKLREIRDTVRHDNFITTEDKNYIESLITMHLKNQPLDKSLSRKQPDTKIKLQPKPTLSSPDLKNSFAIAEILELPEDIKNYLKNVPPDKDLSIDILESITDFIYKNLSKGDYIWIQTEYGITFYIVDFALNNAKK